ncbi:MAG: tRNA dihydrouridine synthase DusB [Fusobacteria bacterium]|nr:tRNA dihydrouridine synthase DusB [Fusobacteriota bacterium]
MKILIAPIAGVTDYPFRKILGEFLPDRIFTEMVSANAIVMGNVKTCEELLNLDDTPSVQIFGSDEKIMLDAAQYIESRGVKHLDINMGCPMKKIIQNGYGSALLSDIKQAEKIVSTLRSGTKMDLSIKIRIGYKEHKEPLSFVQMAQDYNLSFVTVHGRTREQLYSGIADWEIIKNIKQQVDIPIIGNGDIFMPEHAILKSEMSGVDGIMLARGIFGNPWLISQIREFEETGKFTDVLKTERIDMAKRHVELISEYKGDMKALLEGRKHICWYLKGISGATTVKQAVNVARSLEEVYDLLNSFKEELCNGYATHETI